MSEPAAGPPPRSGLAWIARTPLPVLLLAAGLYLPLLGARDLWAPDEPRYAEAAREMVQQGHWWYPHVNGHPYPDKPPLYFWAEAFLASGGEVTEARARLPSVLLALLLMGLSWDLGRRLFDRRAATVGALVLATAWLTAWTARRVNLDIPVAAFTVVAAWASVRAAAAATRAGVAIHAALAGMACALGVMTKGPVILLFALAACVPLVVRAPSPRLERRLLLGACVGGAAFALFLVAWLVPATTLGGYDPIAIVKDQVIDRATEGRHHVQPPWYFLLTLPVDFLPWTFLAVAALVDAWRRRAWRSLPDAMLLSWALVPLVVLSIVVEKRNIYLIPSLPAWALLVGRWVAGRGDEEPRAFRLATSAASVLIALVGGAALALAAVGPRIGALSTYFALEGLRWGLLAAGLTALGGGTLALATWRRRLDAATRTCLLAAAVAAAELAMFATLPALNPVKSGRSVGEAIADGVGNGPLAMYPRAWDTYVFYSGRLITDLGTPAAVRSWLDSSTRPAYLLAYEQDLDVIPADGLGPPVTVTSGQVGHRTVLLLRYDAPAALRSGS